jgi:iron complex outermembrane receptor protein
MKSFSFLDVFTVTSLVAVLAASAGYVSAADLSIEEVIVTGTKRDEAQQELGMAVTALTGNQIKNTFSSDLTTLSQLAPNVRINRMNGFNAVKGGIRGTGGGNIINTNDNPVGILVDEFAMNHSRSQFVKMFDVEQVEIFRGPQGTLFGKNTSAGAISITTKRPVMNEFSGVIEAQMGEYSSNQSKATELNLAVNVPLIEDKLAMRLAVVKDDTDGWVSNNKPNTGYISDNPLQFSGSRDAGPDGRPLGGFDVLAGKLKLLWQPSDRYEAYTIFEYVDDNSAVPASTNETPEGEGYLMYDYGFVGIEERNWDDPWKSAQSTTQDRAIDFDGGHQVETFGVHLHQTFSFDNFSIKSITGYREDEEILASCYTAEQWPIYDASRNTEREIFQQEIRFVSEFDGPYNFVAGAAYYEDNLDFIVFAHLSGYLEMLGIIGSGLETMYNIQATEQERESNAIYFDGTYDVTDRTSISAGVRRTKDKKMFDRLQYSAIGGDWITLDQWVDPFTNPVPRSSFSTDVIISREWSATTWRFVLEHDLSDDVMLYGNASKGFISGGFAETCGAGGGISCYAGYAPEESKSFEIGMKGDFLDGSLRVNAAFFNVTYENLQRTQVVTVYDAQGNQFQETVVVNNGESEADGMELEITWLPSDQFRIDFNVGTLNHDYNDYKLEGVGGAAQIPTMGAPAGYALPDTLDISNLKPPRSPELTWAMSATYDQPLSSGANLTLNVGIDYSDEAEAQPYPASNQGLDADGNFIIKQKMHTQMEEYTLLNAFVRYTTADEKMSVTLFGKNLTEKVYRVDAAAVAGLWNWSNYGEPRLIGMKVDYNF